MSVGSGSGPADPSTTTDSSNGIVDREVYERSVARFREQRILLPTLAQLAEPATITAGLRRTLADVDPDQPDASNLFRVHWHNGRDRRSIVDVPDHVVLPGSLTGVPAQIVVLLGDRFPMIAAHKVLAAYGCLVPRLVTGRFDPSSDKAIWPSTGNYCRGGVAISRIMGCRGVAVLPEGMSRERFEWLDRWVTDPGDVIRTPGTESNVKEIYDECERLAREPGNVILNQFSEFGNHLIHYQCTGRAVERVFESLPASRDGSDRDLRAFVAASGSAGTLGAGDYLKERHGTTIVAVEALECPTMLANGFGEHNIQGIGDKHIPLIHNVTNTDVVAAVSDRATDRLGVLFNSDEGRRYLVSRRGVPEDVVAALSAVGLSGICNILAAIKVAKHLAMGPDDVVATVATDGSQMYGSERDKAERAYFPEGFDDVAAGESYGEHVLGQTTDHLIELTSADRDRIFNLGYFTWVEQRGVSVEDFEARRAQSWWRGLRELIAAWDEMIEGFNARTGVAAE
jgi:cysteine synthase